MPVDALGWCCRSLGIGREAGEARLAARGRRIAGWRPGQECLLAWGGVRRRVRGARSWTEALKDSSL